MKGYKGMESNMTCREFQYELGKTYTFYGRIGLCFKGFHFCKNLRNVFMFYNPHNTGNRFFEIEASDDIIEGDNKCVTSKIKIIQELSRVEVCRTYYGNGYGNGDRYGKRGNYGNGYIYGYGYASGNGVGYGDRNGYNYGYGCPYGYANGTGYGCGENGFGYGNGSADDIYYILKFI